MRCFDGASIAIALTCISAGPVRAQSPTVELDPSVGHYDVFDRIDLLEDPTGTATIEEVAAPPGTARFTQPRKRNCGYTPSAYFVRLNIHNGSAAPQRWYLEPGRRLDHVTLYRARENGGFERASTGRGVSIFERDVRAPALLFPLTLAADERITLYLRIDSTNNVRLNLELYSDGALRRRLARDWAVMGLFYGAILALLIYNLFMFLSVGDRSYLYYSLFQIGFMFWQGVNDDLLHSFLWPHSPWWRICSESFFSSICLIGALAFIKTFLNLKELSRQLNREATVIQGIAVVALLTCPLATTPAYQKAALLCMLVAALAAGRMGFRAWRLGSPNAPFFLIGWAVLVLSSAMGALIALGVANGAQVVDIGGKLGGVSEALVLSLGLASRIHRIRREKERIQAELIESRTAQAAALERLVGERTRELESALAEIQNAQSRMLQQARLASLGHLIAGVAHEVGNPLNFTRGGALEIEKKLGLISATIGAVPDDAALARARAALTDARRAAELVATGNERIRRIIENLRDYTTARPLPLQPTDLVAAVEQTLSMMAPQLETQSVRVICDLSPLPKVPCRSGEIGQVFLNLILNSCQAMPEGGELRIQSRVHEGRAELRFSDSGPGVPREVADAIFDPFFTTRSPREGTGLGLSVSYEIVRRMGGELELADSVRGATFVVRLPLTPEGPSPST
jgi:signal transduction histidine kinase